MDILVLNENFQSVGLVDTYISFIWTDRFDECGDFELVVPSTTAALDLLEIDRYLYIKESDHLMIIEGYESATDSEDGNTLTFTGRSLESILDRRTIFPQTSINGNLQNGIKQLLNETIISPSNTDRKISNFVFEDTTDTNITSNTIEAQYTGDNLYDVICSLCTTFEIGFEITLNSSNQFVFKLYKGVDRSYSQSTKPYVVFSPEFDNIINSNYLESKKTYKNVDYVAGEGEGSDRRYVQVGSGTGLDRREMFTDARDISSTTDDGELSTSDYNAQLTERGEEDMSSYKIVKTFEGELDPSMFKYNTDFKMGDIVQIKDDYGIEKRARISEMIYSHNTNEDTSYPSFTILEDD